MITNPSEKLARVKTLNSSSTTHFTDLADAVLAYKIESSNSERTISAHTGISKTEVHRLLEIARLSPQLKDKAKDHNIEKYVLVKISEQDKALKERLEDLVLLNHIRTVKQLRFQLKRM